MSERPAKHRWFRFGLRMMFVLVTVAAFLSWWVIDQRNWIRQRHQALKWLESSKESWYAPCVQGGQWQASAPWSLRPFGERAIVGIGMDRQQYTGQVSYSAMELKRLFPEARVDYSRDGRYEDAPPD